MERVEVDLTEADPGLSEPLGKPFPSRRGRRRARREAQQADERLRSLRDEHGLTVAIWRETTRDATFGFATGVRWHGIAFTSGGEIVAAVRDVLPLAAGTVKPRLIQQIETARTPPPQ
jgi:hypothetical protein